MGIVNWRKVEQDRNGWGRATGEDIILLGERSHSRWRKVKNALLKSVC
jgi:hypothetical protein